MKLPPGYVPGLLQQHKATAKGGFGERLMKQFGWSEGKGLGVKEDGMAEALRVKQKKDNTGVGANSSGQWRDKWWEDAYAQSISTLKGDQVEISKLKSDSDSSSSSDSEDSSDSEVNVSSDRTDRNLHADGTFSSATAAEAKLAAQLAKDPWGRFGGRQGKMARIRAQEEAQLAALAAKAAPAAIVAGPKRKATGAPEDTSRATSDRSKVKQRKAAAAEPPAESKRLTVVVADPVADQLAAERGTFSPTPASGWWGAKRFISSGAMGAGGNGEKPAGTGDRQQFTEDTQESLYMALHNAKTSGKTGLGKGKGGSGIVGGAKWQGSKISFDDAKHSSDQAATEEAGHVTACGQDGDAAAISPAATAKRFPFFKVISASLNEAEDQQLTVKALCKVVKLRWTSKYGSLPDPCVLKTQVLAKAAKLPGTTTSGKLITLRI